MAKPDSSRVHPSMACEALKRAKGDRQVAYSRYIQLTFRATGRLAPGCDNKDLQAWYDENKESK